MAFIDTYRNAVKAAGCPIISYPVGSFGSYDAMLRYSVTPIASDGALATKLDKVTYICMANAVRRNDFAAHPAWAEAAKAAGLLASGLGGPSKTEDDMVAAQRTVLAKLPTEWLTAAMGGKPAKVARKAIVAATIQPSSEADQIAAATAKALARNGATATRRLAPVATVQDATSDDTVSE